MGVRLTRQMVSTANDVAPNAHREQIINVVALQSRGLALLMFRRNCQRRCDQPADGRGFRGDGI
jgi:hypothetical protein